ncbi:MAG TPA: DNA-directed RNA polymerase subunit alpha C-terminal domain-containing protein, partial [bacterium]|nr:DNA-directed RNA polymerase subunit alpha C-terminal domain-containing protein [bacterium]
QLKQQSSSPDLVKAYEQISRLIPVEREIIDDEYGSINNWLESRINETLEVLAAKLRGANFKTETEKKTDRSEMRLHQSDSSTAGHVRLIASRSEVHPSPSETDTPPRSRPSDMRSEVRPELPKVFFDAVNREYLWETQVNSKLKNLGFVYYLALVYFEKLKPTRHFMRFIPLRISEEEVVELTLIQMAEAHEELQSESALPETRAIVDDIWSNEKQNAEGDPKEVNALLVQRQWARDRTENRILHRDKEGRYLANYIKQVISSRFAAPEQGEQARAEVRSSDSIRELELPSYLIKRLENQGIETISQLQLKTEKELLLIQNVGETRVDLIRKALAGRRLKLKEEKIPRDSIRSLNMPESLADHLEREGITTVSELQSMSLEDLRGLRYMGVTKIGRIESALARRGLGLREETFPEDALDNLYLPESLIKMLEREGISKISQLKTKSREELLKVRGLGIRSVLQIEKALQSYARAEVRNAASQIIDTALNEKISEGQLKESARVVVSVGVQDFVETLRSEVRKKLRELEMEDRTNEVQITPEMAERALRDFTESLLRHVKGAVSFGVDREVNPSFINAFRRVKSKIADLDRLWLSREMAKGLSAEDTKGPVQFVGKWSQYRPTDKRPMPVAVGGDGESALDGYDLLFTIRGVGRTKGEPFFEELADAVDLLVAARLGSGDLIKNIEDLQDPAKRAKIRATLIREFFFDDPTIVTDDGNGFIVNRTALFKRIVAEYAARAEIRKSA